MQWQLKRRRPHYLNLRNNTTARQVGGVKAKNLTARLVTSMYSNRCTKLGDNYGTSKLEKSSRPTIQANG